MCEKHIWGNEIVMGYENWLYEEDDDGGHSRSKDEGGDTK